MDINTMGGGDTTNVGPTHPELAENDLYMQAGGYMHVFSGDADNPSLVEGHAPDCKCWQCGHEWNKANLGQEKLMDTKQKHYRRALTHDGTYVIFECGLNSDGTINKQAVSRLELRGKTREDFHVYEFIISEAFNHPAFPIYAFQYPTISELGGCAGVRGLTKEELAAREAPITSGTMPDTLPGQCVRCGMENCLCSPPLKDQVFSNLDSLIKRVEKTARSFEADRDRFQRSGAGDYGAEQSEQNRNAAFAQLNILKEFQATLRKEVITLDDTEAELHALLNRLQARQQTETTTRETDRALSLAITKLEECLMWLTQANS